MPPHQVDGPSETQKYFGFTGCQLNIGFLVVVGCAIAAACAWLFVFGGTSTITGDVSNLSENVARLTKSIRYKEPTGTPVLTGTPEEAAPAATLALADLPPGWTTSPQETDDDYPAASFSERCKLLEAEAPPGAILTAESADLRGPLGQKVNTDASVFDNDGAAAAALGMMDGAWSTCQHELRAIFTEALRGSLAQEGLDPSLAQIAVSIEEVPPLPVGEAAVMFRLNAATSAPDRHNEFTIDFLAFRQGRMLGGFVYTAFAPPLNVEDELMIAQIAGSKLAAAEAILPQSEPQ
jgi:hypothetical protein